MRSGVRLHVASQEIGFRAQKCAAASWFGGRSGCVRVLCPECKSVISTVIRTHPVQGGGTEQPMGEQTPAGLLHRVSDSMGAGIPHSEILFD